MIALFSTTVLLILLGATAAEQETAQENKQQRQVSEKSDDRKILDSLCPPPWTKFQDLCLWLSGEEKFWEEARSICQEKGGDLVWMASESEHRKINAFLQGKGLDNRYYQIGLYREGFANDGALTWTGGSASQYRGSFFYFQNYKVFVSFSHSLNIFGRERRYHQFLFVCRR